MNARKRKGSGSLINVRFMEISVCLLCILLSGIVWGNVCAGFLAGALEVMALFLSVSMYSFETASGYMIRRRLYRDQVKNVIESMASVMPVSAVISVVSGVICLLLSGRLSMWFNGTMHGIFPYIAIAPAVALLGCQGALRIYMSMMGEKAGVKLCCVIGSLSGAAAGIALGFLAWGFGGKVEALLKTDDIRASYTAAGVCAGISIGALVSLTGLLIIYARSKRSFRESAEEGMSIVIDKRQDILKNLKFGLPVSMAMPLLILADHLVFRLSGAEDADGVILAGGWGGMGGFCLAVFGLTCTLSCIPFLGAWKEMLQTILKKDIPAARTKLAGVVHFEYMLVIPLTFWLMTAQEQFGALFFKHAETNVTGYLTVLLPLAIPAAACLINSYLISGAARNGILLIDLVLAMGVHMAVLIVTVRSTGAVFQSIIFAWYVFILILFAVTMFEIYLMLGYRQQWYKGIFSTVIAAGISVVPAVAVNALLAEHIGEILTLLVSFVLSASLYLVCLVLLRGLTSYELERLPLGEYLLPLADRFERRDGE